MSGPVRHVVCVFGNQGAMEPRLRCIFYGHDVDKRQPYAICAVAAAAVGIVIGWVVDVQDRRFGQKNFESN